MAAAVALPAGRVAAQPGDADTISSCVGALDLPAPADVPSPSGSIELIGAAPAGKAPLGAAYDPGTGLVFVADFLGGGVSVVDPDRPATVAVADAGVAPIAVAADPDGRRVWVANFGSSDLTAIDTRSRAVTARIPVGQNPRGIAFDPMRKRVWVANYGAGNVYVVDAASPAVAMTIPVRSHPIGIGLYEEARRAYIANAGSDLVTVADLESGAVVGEIPVGRCPALVAVDPLTRRVFVTNLGSHTVSIIDAEAGRVVKTVEAGGGPRGIAAIPSLGRVVVADQLSGELIALDAESGDIRARAEIRDGSPFFVAAEPQSAGSAHTARVFVAVGWADSLMIYGVQPGIGELPRASPSAIGPVQDPPPLTEFRPAEKRAGLLWWLLVAVLAGGLGLLVVRGIRRPSSAGWMQPASPDGARSRESGGDQPEAESGQDVEKAHNEQ